MSQAKRSTPLSSGLSQDNPDATAPSRALRLRDAIWARQAMDDLVAAEFALRLEGSVTAAEVVDYERLREQLDTVVDELESGAGATAQDEIEREAVKRRAKADALGLKQRAAEVRARSRAQELAFEDACDEGDESGSWNISKFARSFVDEVKRRAEAVGELSVAAFRGVSSNDTRSRAVLYVRGDGTVDWEGALQGAKAATAFSRDLWRRINGVEVDVVVVAASSADADAEAPASPSSSLRESSLRSRRQRHQGHETTQVGNLSELTQDPEGESLRDRRQKSTVTRRAREVWRRFVASVEATREAAVAKREISAVLMSPSNTPASTRAALRAADAKSRGAEARRYLADLNLALERACAALEIEIESISDDAPDSSFSNVRRLVAEFALLDAQVIALCRDARYSAGPAILEPELAMLRREVGDFCSRVAGGGNIFFSTVAEEGDGSEDDDEDQAFLGFLRSNSTSTYAVPSSPRPRHKRKMDVVTRDLAAARRELANADAHVIAAARKNSDDILAMFKTTFHLLALSAKNAENEIPTLFFPDDASPGSRFAGALDKLRANAARGTFLCLNHSSPRACVSLVGRSQTGVSLLISRGF